MVLFVAKLCVVPLQRAQQWWAWCWVCPRHGCCRRAPRRCCCWQCTRRGTRRCFLGSLSRWRTLLCRRGRCCCSHSRRCVRSQRRPLPPFLLPAGMPSQSSVAIWLAPEQNNYYVFYPFLVKSIKAFLISFYDISSLFLCQFPNLLVSSVAHQVPITGFSI